MKIKSPLVSSCIEILLINIFCVLVIFIMGLVVSINQKPQQTYSEQLYEEFHCSDVWNWINKNENTLDYNKTYKFKACGDDYYYYEYHSGKSSGWIIYKSRK